MRTIDEILDKIMSLENIKNDAALAKCLRVKPNTVSTWRKRKTLPYDVLIQYCDDRKYDIGWLLTGKITAKYIELDGKRVLTSYTEPGPHDERSIAGKKDSKYGDYTYIPQVNGKISAGKGLAPDNVIEMRVAFRKEWIARKGNARNMVLVKVSGDSMEPTLLNGDLVLIDRGRDYFEPQGGIYAIAVDDTIMIKRVQLVGDRVKVISDNKMYEPFEVGADQVKINGKVIWFARELER